jgi:hypothetical protein
MPKSNIARTPKKDERARLERQILIDQERLKESIAKLNDFEAGKPVPCLSQTEPQSGAKQRIAKRKAQIKRLRVQQQKYQKQAEREGKKQVIAARRIEIYRALDAVDACQLEIFAAKNTLDGIPKTDKVALRKAQAAIHQAYANLSMAKAKFRQLQDDFKQSHSRNEWKKIGFL